MLINGRPLCLKMNEYIVDKEILSSGTCKVCHRSCVTSRLDSLGNQTNYFLHMNLTIDTSWIITGIY